MSNPPLIHENINTALTTLLSDLIPILDENENIYEQFPLVFDETPLALLNKDDIPPHVLKWYKRCLRGGPLTRSHVNKSSSSLPPTSSTDENSSYPAVIQICDSASDNSSPASSSSQSTIL